MRTITVPARARAATPEEWRGVSPNLADLIRRGATIFTTRDVDGRDVRLLAPISERMTEAGDDDEPDVAPPVYVPPVASAPAAPAAPPPSSPKPKAAPSLGEQLAALQFADLPAPGEARSFGELLSLSNDTDTTTTPDLGAQLADMEP